MTHPLHHQLQQQQQPAPTNTYTSPPLPEYVSAPDYHEGLKQIRAHLGRDCGFGIAISRTKSYTPQKTGEKRITRVALQCARSKDYKSKGVGQKVYATRMTGCPWRAKMVPHPGGGWKVTHVCPEHNHPLNDQLDDRGLPPRARTTPAKGARATAVERSFATPPVEPQMPTQATFMPTMSAVSAWPTTSASGIKVYCSSAFKSEAETDLSLADCYPNASSTAFCISHSTSYGPTHVRDLQRKVQ